MGGCTHGSIFFDARAFGVRLRRVSVGSFADASRVLVCRWFRKKRPAQPDIATCVTGNSTVQMAALLRRYIDSVALYLFVNNRHIYYWHCHRRKDRSFFVRGRQFHLCARCTGLFTGAILSPLSLWFAPLCRSAFPLAVILLALDGGSQMLGWRRSTNMLRFTSGIVFAWTFCGACFAILH